MSCVLGQSKDKSEHSSLIKVEVNLDLGRSKDLPLYRNEVPTDELKRAKQNKLWLLNLQGYIY